jgi:hypothetical protein
LLIKYNKIRVYVFCSRIKTFAFYCFLEAYGPATDEEEPIIDDDLSIIDDERSIIDEDLKF